MCTQSKWSTDLRLRRFSLLSALIVAVWVGFLLPGCPTAPVDIGDNGDGQPNARASDCIGCHTDEALLKTVARDEPPPVEDEGEG